MTKRKSNEIRIICIVEDKQIKYSVLSLWLNVNVNAHRVEDIHEK